jgi:hypothetical protein
MILLQSPHFSQSVTVFRTHPHLPQLASSPTASVCLISPQIHSPQLFFNLSPRLPHPVSIPILATTPLPTSHTSIKNPSTSYRFRMSKLSLNSSRISHATIVLAALVRPLGDAIRALCEADLAVPVWAGAPGDHVCGASGWIGEVEDGVWHNALCLGVVKCPRYWVAGRVYEVGDRSCGGR